MDIHITAVVVVVVVVAADVYDRPRGKSIPESRKWLVIICRARGGGVFRELLNVLCYLLRVVVSRDFNWFLQ